MQKGFHSHSTPQPFVKLVSSSLHTLQFSEILLLVLIVVVLFRDIIPSGKHASYCIIYYKLFDVLLQAAVNFNCLPSYKKKINVPVFRAMA